MMKPDLQAVISRLETVEKQNHQLKKGMGFVLVVACAFVFMGAAESENPKIIKAQAFQVVNQEGETVAALGIGESGNAYLVVSDKEKKRSAGIGISPKGNGFGVGYSLNGKVLVSIGGGLEGPCGISVQDENGTMRVGMGGPLEDYYGVVIADKDGNPSQFIPPREEEASEAEK